MTSTESQNWKHSDAASYDHVAATYDQYVRILSEPLARRICEIAILTPGMDVLDVGTGSGIAARRAAEVVGPRGHVLGVDLSEGMITTANAAGSPVGGAMIDYRVMDAEKLEFPENNFDAVISLCAVFHFPAITDALSEMYRVLKPGGRLTVSFGYVRPISPYNLAVYFGFEIFRRMLQPVRPVLKAPEDLLKVIRSRDSSHEEELHTEWSRHRPRLALFREVKNAGFQDVRRDWVGHEWRCGSPEEFWDAQIAIVTHVRKRLRKFPDQTREEIRQQYLEKAKTVLERGGSLAYRYGAYMVSGIKPG